MVSGDQEAERLHRRLFDGLQRRGDIPDQRIEAAFRAVRRRRFLEINFAFVVSG